MLNYFIIVIVLVLIALVIIKANKPDFKYEANKVSIFPNILNVKWNSLYRV